MKFFLLVMLAIVTAPAYAFSGTYIGMIFATTFVVVMLILYWLVVGQVGAKDKNKSDKEKNSPD